MSEKLYKIVSGVGAGSIALGIITLVTGVTTGVLLNGGSSGGNILYDHYLVAILDRASKKDSIAQEHSFADWASIMQKQSRVNSDWILMCFSDLHTRNA